MEFSLIIPSRKRVNLLSLMLNSIKEKTKELSQIEVLVIFDSDDQPTRNFISKQNESWIISMCRERGNNLSKDYYNWAISKTSGNYIWALNDDAEIKTSEWDQIILEKMRNVEIAMASVSSPHYDFKDQEAPFSYFPLLTRKTVERLGYLLPEEFSGWGADHRLSMIFDMAGKIVPIPEVKVNHVNGRKLQDECFKAMELRSFLAFADIFSSNANIEKEVKKLL